MALFGTSGIRGVADRSLLEIALKTGLVVGKEYGKVIVGSDTRTSSEAIKHAFISGLLTAGAWCWDSGVIPTPTLALATREFQAGAMITASHNPPEYNGIKLLNADGSAFDANQRRQIEDMILSDVLSTALWADMKNSRNYDSAIEQHVEHLRKDLPHALKLKVVLDCGCGATSVIAPYLLRQLGCEVVELNCYPSGFFPHDVEPTETNLGDLIRVTREIGADLGIAHDGDGDRMMAVDEQGRFIPGDKLLVLFAQQVGAKEIVTTLDASMVVDELGFKVTRTKVGDIYVSEELKKSGDFGGEPSGAWIFPNSSLCPDGIYAAAKLLAIASRHKLSVLVDQIPQYPLFRGSIASEGVVLSNLKKRLQTLKPLSVSDIDGLRLSFENGWLLIRASGTEPKIRLTAEAKSEPQARQLYDNGLQIIKECCLVGEDK
ncbi:MAG: phosphoglucosamine mutase [Dehalococcoidales bacterium]|jgi:phosphoglucosamine mutase|nr:phosphoglucosamine mutase [Dehalococcoidales bacterium]MDP7409546.1 phosphoglucosamine mutase [Dehalococcoidales bacterium]MDP7675880.1 phosphoglucosamine mutase [Dehalococcoidales bacterium]